MVLSARFQILGQGFEHSIFCSNVDFCSILIKILFRVHNLIMYNLDWLSTYALNAFDQLAECIMAVDLYVAIRKLLKITLN